MKLRIYLLHFASLLLVYNCSYAQIITTAVGTGSAAFSGDGGLATAAALHTPHGITFDAAGNLYICDVNNNRIRKVTPAGIISTIAGTGVAGDTPDGALATATKVSQPFDVVVDAAGNIYYCDQNNHKVKKISTSGIVNTIAGTGTIGFTGDGGPATSARLNTPTGLVFDVAGNLYFADQYNHRIRKISPAGIITTVAGTGSAAYGGDGGPATAASLSFPNFLSLDNSGNVLITDNGNHRIRRLTPGGIITTIVGNGVSTFAGDGGQATNASIYYPGEAMMDAAGNIYVSDNINNRIRLVNTSGFISTFCGTGAGTFCGDGGPAISACINGPVDIAIDGAGSLHISDLANNRIRKIVFSNTPPQFVEGASTSLSVCQNAPATSINSLLAATDINAGQTLTWSLLLSPAHGTASVGYTTTATGSTVTPTGLTYTPTAGYTGTDVFSVIVSDGSANDTITINVNIAPLPSAGTISGPSSVCAGSTVTMATTGAGGTWSSSNTSVATITSASGVLTPLSGGTTIISYTVTNACGSATDTQLVNVIPPPSAGLVAGPANICPGTSVTFTNSTTGGTWSSSNTAVATINASSGNAGGVAVGTAIISYTVTNSCGTATDTQMVSVTYTASAGVITGPTHVCPGASISLSNATPGGTWTSSNTSIATVSTTGIVGGVASGIAIISYTVTNLCGSATDTQTVVIDALPATPLITGTNILCVGSSSSIAASPTGGTWTSSAPGIANVSGGTLNGLAAGTAIISYTLTNLCGSSFDTLPVTVFPPPASGTLSATSIVCLGGTITVTPTVTGGNWSSSNTSVATINGSGAVFPTTPGTTIITYTVGPDDNGCSSAATITININPAGSLPVNSVVAQPLCHAENTGSITVSVSSGSGSYQYAWSNGAATAGVTGLAAGSYTVVVTDVNSYCSDTVNFNIIDPSAISVNSSITADRCHAAAGSISLIDVVGGQAPYSYLWSAGGTTTNVSGLAAGSYQLTVTDANSCTATFTISVAEDSCTDIIVHDVITPNGDGINDTWVIEGIGAYPNSTVQLFDKWGDVVFSAKDYTNDFNGGTLPDGTYIYLIKLGNGASSNGKDAFTGTFLIKR